MTIDQKTFRDLFQWAREVEEAWNARKAPGLVVPCTSELRSFFAAWAEASGMPVVVEPHQFGLLVTSSEPKRQVETKEVAGQSGKEVRGG